MRALLIADLHLSAKARDAYRFEVMATVATLLEKHKADYLIVSGDLTEEKDFHPAPLVNDVVDIVHSFSQFCEVLVLRGNHDYTRDDFPFFRFLRRLKRVRWINTVSRIDLGKVNCLFLPHTRDYENDWIKLPHVEELQFIFAHNTFEGATTEHGKKLSGIPTSFFDDEDLPIVSGDIHTPQILGPVTYVGAPYQIDFGDDYDPRALLIDWYGHRDYKFTSIPLPGPQKRLLDFDTSVIGHMRREFNKGDIIKARVKLALNEQANWLTIRSKVRQELTELGAVVHLVQPVTTEREKGSVKIKKVTTKSDDLVVKDYGAAVKTPEATLKTGLEFLKEA
jgi:DNA repair exonuclease SbcCD nuclease subunit